jgi:uncharacterized protein YhfF
MRTRLNQLVLDGTKTATAGLWRHEYQTEGEVLDEVGERQVLLDSEDQPLATVVVDRVESYAFVEVPWEFAFAEGEGFESVTDWQRGHREYYAGEGVEVSDDDRVVCVWFRVLP